MDIKDFLDSEDIRLKFSKPFNVGNKTCGTNGHILLFIPINAQYSNLEGNPKQFEGFIKTINEVSFTELKKPPMPTKTACETCNGTGKATKINCKECDGDGYLNFSSDFNEYEIECKSCDGDGNILSINTKSTCPICNGAKLHYPHSLRHDSVEIAGVHLNLNYASLLIDEKEQVHVSKFKDHMLAFKCGNQSGIMMGMSV